jgi:hypothetical protein
LKTLGYFAARLAVLAVIRGKLLWLKTLGYFAARLAVLAVIRGKLLVEDARLFCSQIGCANGNQG